MRYIKFLKFMIFQREIVNIQENKDEILQDNKKFLTKTKKGPTTVLSRQDYKKKKRLDTYGLSLSK